MAQTPMTEALAVIDILATRLDRLGISYLVGGSVASSLYGIFRFTNDADIVVDLLLAQVDELVAALQEDFYVSADMIREALGHGLSFNVIYLPTMVKADIFPPKRTPFGQSEWARRRQEKIRGGEEGERWIFVASPEDMILQKLEWYRLTGERSDRQWGDVQGILKVQANALDFDYLRKWAVELSLTGLLQSSFADAGLSE